MVKINDYYWDQKNFWITKADWFLRNRNGKWELKVGDNSSKKNLNIYHEFNDLQEIAKRIKVDYKNDQDFEQVLRDCGYFMMCPIHKTRTKLKINEFNIDIDEGGYGDNLFEIELMVEDNSQIDKALEKIFKFVKELDITPKPKKYGKVIDYIKDKYPKLYKELIEEGLVQE